MGITSLALQYLTIAAIKGQTLAGNSVFAGSIDALDVDVARMSVPTIAVFLGDDDRKAQGRDLNGSEHRVELLVQAFLPAEVTVTIDGNDLALSSRGGAAELVMSVLRRQIERALLSSDSDAAELWRILVAEIETSSAIPFLFQITPEVRIAANEISYLCRFMMHEPSFGQQEIGDFWGALISLFRADPDYEPVAAWIEAEMTAPGGLPGWRIAQGDLGLTAEGLSGIGIAPVDLTETANPPPVDGATVDTDIDEPWTLP